MREELLEKEILKNNKMARMISVIACGTVRDMESIDAIHSLSEDIILDPKEMIDKEEAIRFQSSMILDLLVLYTKYASSLEGVMKKVLSIRHSDEMQTLQDEQEELEEEV